MKTWQLYKLFICTKFKYLIIKNVKLAEPAVSQWSSICKISFSDSPKRIFHPRGIHGPGKDKSLQINSKFTSKNPDLPTIVGISCKSFKMDFWHIDVNVYTEKDVLQVL